MSLEIWKEIDGTDGRYFVSSHGRIKSLARGPEKILLGNIEFWGYARVCILINGERKSPKIHRLVALAFVPNPDNKPDINHINGIKTDNRPENLEWVTPAENNLHAFRSGLNTNAGQKHSRSLITDVDALSIKGRLRDGAKPREIAKDYGLSIWMIYAIKQGRNWDHVHLI